MTTEEATAVVRSILGQHGHAQVGPYGEYGVHGSHPHQVGVKTEHSTFFVYGLGSSYEQAIKDIQIPNYGKPNEDA